MLRSVDLVAAHDVPIIGINVGQLGYLTEVDPADWERALTGWLAGEAEVDERMLLAVRVERADGQPGPDPTIALNEAVLEKTPMGHTVRMRVHLDGTFFTTYAADGLIVATPTGSTAYSLSARGPIVAPRHRAVLLTPVSPHMLFDRTLVLEPTTEVCLEVCGHRPATLSVDGRNQGELTEGDAWCAPRPTTRRGWSPSAPATSTRSSRPSSASRTASAASSSRSGTSASSTSSGSCSRPA